MKTGSFVIFTVLILYSIQVSHQSASQATSLSSSQTWPEENHPEEYKKQEKLEEETVHRPRGKRRRRMRKRPRVQVEDRTNNPEHEQDHHYERTEVEDEGVTPVAYPRRRPGKRRRRPYRRYQDDDNGPPKPLRRRRKGGRKKVRPEIHEEPVITEAPQEQIRNEDNYEIETTTTSLLKENDNINENLTEDKVLPTESNIKVYQSINQLKIKEPQDEKLINNNVKSDKEEINIDKTTEYGNKIFDRKKLFSNSRRMLPVTSAVIRRLNPSIKTNGSEIQNEQAKAEHAEQLKTPEKSKMVIKNYSLSDSHVVPIEFIKPESLIEQMRKKEQNKEENDTIEEEEPNYPKIIPKLILNKIKEQEITTHSVIENIEINQTENPINTLELQQNKSMEEEFERMIDNLDLKTFNITNFNDYILELLKTKSGKEYLSNILESRNMTLAQLLEHRERGSSQFHLFELFPQKKNAEESSTQATTSTVTTIITSTSKRTPSKDEANILFPSKEIMESFPKFMAGELEKYEQKKDKVELAESTSIATRESREPRLFDSMPQFTTSMPSASKEEKPIWRIIPNPKFRPVSVRGNYEEIPVSHILNKQLENNINDMYIVDETQGQTHKKYGLSATDGTTKRDSFGSFKKIPVGVKSAIIISGIILAIATFGFLSLLISCRVCQKRSILRAKQDLMCEHLQNEDFMASQHSLSPVLTKHQQVYSSHDVHSHPNNRQYYLWKTLRRTFRYD